MSSLPWLNADNFQFPSPDTALHEPNGLLAAGGSLEPERLLEAYTKGIFPWFEEGQPILWWTPNPRMVLYPNELHVSRSLARIMKKHPFHITSDTAFREVVIACAGDRPNSSGTWITDEMAQAYCRLHELGAAHTVEVWEDGLLVGGLYGLAIGNVFFGESMFSHRDNASKVAFVTLVRKLAGLAYEMIDCQVASPFLASFGAREISRSAFMKQLPKNPDYGRNQKHWPIQ